MPEVGFTDDAFLWPFLLRFLPWNGVVELMIGAVFVELAGVTAAVRAAVTGLLEGTVVGGVPRLTGMAAGVEGVVGGAIDPW
jgi:hypothetical protein